MRFAAVFVLALSSLARAESRVVVGRATVFPGQYFDVDSGTVLSRPALEGARAEWKFVVDATFGASIETCEGATVARWQGAAGEFSPNPLESDFDELGAGHVALENVPAIAGRTVEGRYYRAILCVAQNVAPRGARGGPVLGGTELTLDFECQSDGTKSFPAPVSQLRARFADGRVLVSWKGGAGARRRVEWAVGEKSGAVEVDGAATELEGLPEGGIGIVTVTPLLEGGGAGTPRSVPIALTGEFARRFRISHDLREAKFPINLRRGTVDPNDPDVIVEPGAVHVPEGGGLAPLTGGSLDSECRLPHFGYRTKYFDARPDGHFAIRLRDGRVALIVLSGDLRPRDLAQVATVEALVLLGGGLSTLASPEPVRASYEEGRTTLGWKAPGDGGEYVVARREGQKEVALLRTKELSCVLEGLPDFSAVELSVTWISPDGERSTPAFATVDTWPPDYKRGTATVSGIHGGFDFAAGRAVNRIGANPPATDFYFDQTRMNGREITLVCPGGIARELPAEFGRFGKKDALRFKRSSPATEVMVPFRAREDFHACLLTRDGAYVQVRFEELRGLELRIHWILLEFPEPPDFDTMLKELLAKAPGADGEAASKSRALVRSLQSDDPAERDEAHAALCAAGLAAVPELDKAAKGEDEEVRGKAREILTEIWLELE